MPVVISEYGVPSSRGNAHVQPQGWNHGGHSEAAQAAIDARLTRDIHAAGAAGAGLFALIDEWFKKNWIVIDFEQPLERNRLWLNALDAEQNYGLIAMRAGARDSAITIDGAGSDWRARGRWYAAPNDSALPAPLRLRELRVTHDEAYVYLRLTVGAIDWARGRYLIGISTIGDSLGDWQLPYTGTRSPVGLEFVVDLADPADSRVLVDSPYNLYKRVPITGSRPPVTIVRVQPAVPQRAERGWAIRYAVGGDEPPPPGARRDRLSGTDLRSQSAPLRAAAGDDARRLVRRPDLRDDRAPGSVGRVARPRSLVARRPSGKPCGEGSGRHDHSGLPIRGPELRSARSVAARRCPSARRETGRIRHRSVVAVAGVGTADVARRPEAALPCHA
jgi:hypothetical protein